MLFTRCLASSALTFSAKSSLSDHIFILIGLTRELALFSLALLEQYRVSFLQPSIVWSQRVYIAQHVRHLGV